MSKFNIVKSLLIVIAAFVGVQSAMAQQTGHSTGTIQAVAGASHRSNLIREAQTLDYLRDKTIIPLYSGNQFVAGLYLIGEGTYVTAAHVLQRMSEEDFKRSLIQGGLSVDHIKLYKLSLGSQTLDAALIIDRTKTNIRASINLLNLLSATARTGDTYSVPHVYQIDGLPLKQLSTGPIATSPDFKYIFLADNQKSTVSWGTSGAIVWVKQGGLYNLTGVVQCLVPSQTKPEAGHEPKVYFRATSIQAILLSRAEEANYSFFHLNSEQFLPKDCQPVGNQKDGGGD